MPRDQDGHFKTSKGAWFCLADPGVATQTATVNCGKMLSDAEKPCSKGLGTKKLLLTTTTLGKGSSTTNDATANVVLDVMFNTNRSARNYEDAMGRALDSALASNLVQITRALDQYESQARQAKAGEAAPPRDAAAQESGPP
jgi:hypothetical protein